MNCPGSIRLSRGIEQRKSSYAAEGSAAHKLAEMTLGNKAKVPIDFLGEEIEIEGDTFVVDDEMADAVSVYVDFVRGLVQPGDEPEFECRFDLSNIYPGMFGTADCVIYRPSTKELWVIDYKHGKGVPVEAENNLQLLYYGLGAATAKQNRGLLTVHICVVQPRCPHPKGPVRVWDTDVVSLIDHAGDLVAAARATEAADAPLKAGDWCKFCLAAPTCPALRDKAMQTAMADFDDTGAVHAPDPTTLSGEQLAQVLANASILKDWLKRVDEFAHHEAEAGRIPPGFKLVARRATRKWRSADEAQTYLRSIVGLEDDQIFVEPKMKSPAQVEAVLGKKRKSEIASLWDSVSSGTVLAPLDDARPVAIPDAVKDFSD